MLPLLPLAGPEHLLQSSAYQFPSQSALQGLPPALVLPEEGRVLLFPRIDFPEKHDGTPPFNMTLG